VASLDAIFKAYDIRGLLPDELDAGPAWKIGAAFARLAGAISDAEEALACACTIDARGATRRAVARSVRARRD
jgi:phosphomannomutase